MILFLGTIFDVIYTVLGSDAAFNSIMAAPYILLMFTSLVNLLRLMIGGRHA